MYNKKVFTGLLFCGLFLAACTLQQEEEVEITHASHTDSTSYAIVNISGDFPIATDEITKTIRDTLLALIDSNLSNPDYSEARTIAPYTGTDSSWNSIVSYYGKAIFKQFETLSMRDEKERIAYMQESGEYSKQEIEEMTSYVPQWQYEMTVSQSGKGKKYIVFSCNTYVYMGGAHGGTGGVGDITFDLRNGQRFTHFFTEDAQTRMQGLLQEGLIDYFADDMDTMTVEELWDNLQIDGNEIPLPTASPTPTSEGLVLIYGQYEIACYAAGMPSFTIPYDALWPYLTPEAKELLDLK